MSSVKQEQNKNIASEFVMLFCLQGPRVYETHKQESQLKITQVR